MTRTTKAHPLAQRTLIAGAALLATCGLAQAQNVTLYGRVDATVEYVSKTASAANATVDAGNLTRLNNGGILPSIWGLRGSEDLGGGLKAVFNLEADFDSSTGGARFGGALNGFGRQANVGIASGFGTVLLGRQYAPALLAELGVEPRGYKESYSGLLTYALNQNPPGNGITGNNFLGIFTGNMISYTGSFGPVTIRGGYGLGEVAKSSDAHTVSLGATYVGPVTVAGSYQQIKGGATNGFAQTERYAVGVAVPISILTLKAHYARTQEDAVSGLAAGEIKTDNFGVGADVAWMANNTATIAYYLGKTKNAPNVALSNPKTNTLVVSNDYALSKRTTLYGQLVYVDDKTGKNLAGPDNSRNQITAGLTPRGDKASIFGVGIKHDF